MKYSNEDLAQIAVGSKGKCKVCGVAVTTYNLLFPRGWICMKCFGELNR